MKKGGKIFGIFPAKNRGGQVWVETVIYTLIAMVMIGLVLTFVQPKILELSDRATVQQSISMMNDINSVILSVLQSGAGNVRKAEITLRAGTLVIDGADEKIIFSLEKSHYQLSEPDQQDVYYGDILVYTHQVNELNSINMTLDYAQYNLTYQGADAAGAITKASTPYVLFISNNDGAKVNIDFNIG
ncbi:MAG: hypothetical protein PHH00_01450 [Candidatus Nanoarchaeia archaeon]|nr:hypothetical protein [Candidatus Nanoarchaeia archaeon]